MPADEDPVVVTGGEKAEFSLTSTDEYEDEGKEGHYEYNITHDGSHSLAAPTLPYAAPSIPPVSLPPPALLSSPDLHDAAPPIVVTSTPRSYSSGQARPNNGNSKPTQSGSLRAPVPVRVAIGTGLAPLVPAVMPSLLAPSLISSSRGPAGNATTSTGASSSSSPAPSLKEAIRIERLRRATAGNATSPVPKGARFKSSPLTGDRAGIVAERVKDEPHAKSQADAVDSTTDSIGATSADGVGKTSGGFEL